MWKNIGLEQCLSFINCQLSPGGTGDHTGASIHPAITISRMTGSGGRSVASRLAEYLQKRVPAESPWTVFDRNLVEKVLEEHHLPKETAKFMHENHRSMLGDTVEELLGMHPSSWTLAQKTARTILHLAQAGHVILVGRGANVITRRLDNVFHVRLVGSLEKRIERIQELYQLDRKKALAFVVSKDKGRKRYLKDNFDKDIDDPLLYHLTINTDRLPYDATARLIGDEVIRRFRLVRSVEVAAA
jgi:cytidylate kinase